MKPLGGTAINTAGLQTSNKAAGAEEIWPASMHDESDQALPPAAMHPSIPTPIPRSAGFGSTVALVVNYKNIRVWELEDPRRRLGGDTSHR